MKWLTRPALGLLIVSTAALGGGFTDEQLEARFYYDLGPERVDISAYPQEERRHYQIFLKTCSRCHTLARPINSPLTARRDWKRYIARMRIKSKAAPAAGFSAEEAQAILSFLAYDSNARKVRGKVAFEKQTAKLRKLFEAVKAERRLRQQRSDQKKVKPYNESPGATPRVQ